MSSNNNRNPPRSSSIGTTQYSQKNPKTSNATSSEVTNPSARRHEGTLDDRHLIPPESGGNDGRESHGAGALNSGKSGLPSGPKEMRGQGTIPTNEIPLTTAELKTIAAGQAWAEQTARTSTDIRKESGAGAAQAGHDGTAGMGGTGINDTEMDVGNGTGATGKSTGTAIGDAGSNAGTGVETAGRGVGTGSSAVGRGLETGVGATGGGAGTGVGDAGRGGQLDKDRRRDAERQAMDARKKRDEESARQAEEARRRQEEAKRKQQEEERQWLQNEIIRLDQENRLAAQDIQDLEVKNESLKVANKNLGHQWSKLSAELDAQRKVLNATRAFASREGTVDAQALIQLFNDLNASIGDYAFEVLRGLNDKAESRSLDGDDFANITGLFRTPSNDPNDSTVDPNIGKFLERLEKMKDDLTPMDIIDPIIQFTLCRHLYSQIFMPFAPSLTVENSDALHDIYTKMRRSEPQERSARWRSITYKQALNMQKPGALHKFIEDETNAFVKLVYDILNALNKGEEAKPPTDLFKAAGDIFQAAMKVQERAKTEYVSFDYEVTFYRREYQPSREIVDGKEKTVLKMMRPSFDPSLMEASQGAKGTTPRSVWMTVGLGMIALKGVRTEGGMKSEMSTPVKAKVIGDNWDPNA